MNPFNDILGANTGAPKATFANPEVTNLSVNDLAAHMAMQQIKAMGLGKITNSPLRNNWNFLSETFYTTCPRMEYAKQTAKRIAGQLDGYPALILGPTGTGKERLAMLIHGARPQELFLSVNCGGLVDTLFESILYGYKANSFSGATNKDRAGMFMAAGNGTVFLDEIGNLPKRQQASLMTALSTRKVQPVGDTESYEFNCQVVLATNKDLKAMVQRGEFMEDLYYRITRIILRTTALSERPADARHIAESLILARPDLYGSEPLEPQEVVPITSGNVRAIEHWLWRRKMVFEGSELTDGLEVYDN